MNIKVCDFKKASKLTTTLVVFATQSTPAKKQKEKKEAPKVSLPPLDKEISSLVDDLVSEKAFTGKSKETVFFRNCGLSGFTHLLVCGLGASKNINLETVRLSVSAAYQSLKAQHIKNAGFHVEGLKKAEKQSALIAQAMAESLVLSSYDFNDFKSKPKNEDKVSFSAFLVLDKKVGLNSCEKGVQAGQILAEATNFSRWLGDNPGNVMNPDRLAKETQKNAKGSGLKVTIWDRTRIEKEKMGGLIGVSLGSLTGSEPRFIVMEYKGAAASKKPVCFVGKGLTFDCGGVSLKPPGAMDEMRYDMCGGANVIGAMLAIARLKLKVNAIGFVPSTENMIGPLANKPGDILTARNGKTVEVLNTDAEGRLILMDAIAYASEKKPAAIFDAATLTGAIVVALGNTHTGVFTRDTKLYARIKKAADTCGESTWPMPITDDHKADMKGNHADLANISSFRGAGSSTAAAFLENFVDEDIPWAHFDIAGTAWNVNNRLNYCPKKGASGVMVRTFVELAKSY